MSTMKVLVVDPNPATKRRIEEALAGTAVDILVARDPVEAEARAQGIDLGLVLASASLPKGNGYDLARALRDRHPAAAVVLMTGGFEVYNRARAEEAGVVGHVAKPVSVAGLRGALEQWVGPLPVATPIVAEAEPEADAQLPPVEMPDEAMTPLDEPAPAPIISAQPPPRSFHRRAPAPPPTEERFATIIPRDYKSHPLVSVDPDVVGPALERAVLEVLPEVVEAVIRNAVASSPAFRDLVAVAVEEAVREMLPAIAAKAVRERIAEIERSTA